MHRFIYCFISVVDVTVYHRNYHGDLNETFLVGKVSPAAKKLVQVTWECLDKAINIGKVFKPKCIITIV